MIVSSDQGGLAGADRGVRPGSANGDIRGGWTRRSMLRLGCGLAAAWASRVAFGQPAPAAEGEALYTPAARQSVRRGLHYLRDRQSDSGEVRFQGQADPVSICALAGMAFLASGSTPGRGPYGRPLDLCTEYLLDKAATPFIHTPGGGNRPMYGHGFATLFLAEVYGMANHPQLRHRLAAAVKLIVDSQNPQGGWRYQPRQQDADVSVSSAQLIALRAAKNAGINVPERTVEQAVGYLVALQNQDGGFCYMLPSDESAFPRSAAALTALLSAGMRGTPEVARGMDYLHAFQPDPAHAPTVALDTAPEQRYFFYGHYYAAQAMWQAAGATWPEWYSGLRDLLLNNQLADGSWASDISPEYATAMACFALQIPFNGVPVLQR